MICGIGVDIVKISRIKNLIDLFGERFYTKVFGDYEIKSAPTHGSRKHYEYFAGRFAAKESFVKALGTGFIGGLSMKKIEILNDSLGKPFVLIPNDYPGSDKNILVSLSADTDYAIAFIILTSR